MTNYSVVIPSNLLKNRLYTKKKEYGYELKVESTTRYLQASTLNLSTNLTRYVNPNERARQKTVLFGDWPYSFYSLSVPSRYGSDIETRFETQFEPDVKRLRDDRTFLSTSNTFRLKVTPFGYFSFKHK